MNGSKRGVTEGAWNKELNTVHNIKKILIYNDNTKVLYLLTKNTKECNNCKGNLHIYNPTYGIVDTGAGKKYIKVDTPCVKKLRQSKKHE